MRHAVLVTLGIVALGASSWWLFGWRSHDNFALGRIGYHRYFGRYTRITLDADRDGRVDMEVRYSWSEPYIGIVDGLCGDSFISSREDRNRDGQWDTWTSRMPRGSEGPCSQLRLEADTELDGKPDWSKVIQFGETQATYAELKELRGF